MCIIAADMPADMHPVQRASSDEPAKQNLCATVQEGDWKSSMTNDGDSAVPDNPGDGRWDFAKILGQDA